jgi:hypothetical protein
MSNAPGTHDLILRSDYVLYCKVLTVSLAVPEPYYLSRRLEALDKGILDARHVEEPGYSAYGTQPLSVNLIL